MVRNTPHVHNVPTLVTGGRRSLGVGLVLDLYGWVNMYLDSDAVFGSFGSLDLK